MSEETFQPIVGMHVKLSAESFKRLWLDSEEAFKQAQSMRITYVENIGYESEPVWLVEVDQPLINKFLLEASMLKPLK